MKRIAIFLLLLSWPAWAVTVEVNGIPLPSQPAAKMDGGRVSVPMRTVFTALGADVSYDKGVISATRGGTSIVLRPSQMNATVNGQWVMLDSPAQVVNGTTYVPLRFVAQALGEKVAWEAATQRVTVGAQVASLGPSSTAFQAQTALKRLVVGNQGGVLKVWDPALSEVAYYRGLDDRSVAPLTADDQEQILSLLGLEGSVDTTARQLIQGYHGLPQKEALALLGVFNSLDGTTRLSRGAASEIRNFLSSRLRSDSNVQNRRQAVLALAVGNGLEDSTIDAVLDFYTESDNLWETFPVQQFFEYQAPRLKTAPNFAQVKTRAGSVDSLYRQNILSYLGN